MVTSLSERLQNLLNETAYTRTDLVQKMGFVDEERGRELLDRIINDDQLPGTRQDVQRLARGMEESVEELDALVHWEYLGKRLENMEQQRRTQTAQAPVRD